jgi:hypothetical protein
VIKRESHWRGEVFAVGAARITPHNPRVLLIGAGRRSDQYRRKDD